MYTTVDSFNPWLAMTERYLAIGVARRLSLTQAHLYHCEIGTAIEAPTAVESG